MNFSPHRRQTSNFITGATNAVASRAGLMQIDTGNEFRGYTMFEIARAALEREGQNVRGMDRMKVIMNAMTTSDFPSILENVASKSMMKGYEEADETFQKWTSVGTLSDFKSTALLDLTAFPSLQKVIEGAEYKYAYVGERKEQIQLATYGALFSISRQAIINDDLAAFTKVPQKMGRAAIRTVGNLVYAVLTSNPNMADGNPLFDETNHANVASSGLYPTAAAVDRMRVSMALQKDRKQTDTSLGIRLKYLLSPITLGGALRQVVASQWDPSTTKGIQIPNPVQGIAEVIDDPRLDAASTQVWYGAADAKATDTIEVSYLDGVQTPTLEQNEAWKNDGIEYKVRLDAAVKALSWEGLSKDPGNTPPE